MNLRTLKRITEPRPGPITSRLPNLFARKNAALIASIMKAKEGRE